MKSKVLLLALLVIVLAALTGHVLAQNPAQGNTAVTQAGLPIYYLTPISATAAVNTQTTLTIPAPPAGLSNYVCYLAYQLNADGTGAAVANAVSTSTNFNSFAVKVSAPSTIGYDSGAVQVLQGHPGMGCAKSIIPGTATTFVSASGLTHAAWTWYATYFVAP
jgi:hypothetical protein